MRDLPHTYIAYFLLDISGRLNMVEGALIAECIFFLLFKTRLQAALLEELPLI